jgi:NAD(P)-dependent dehydrogenase (short-subunit alcohol dehydrogenase family)
MATSARKLAIVTGTSSGVGLAAATRFLERDWNVIGVSRRASSHTNARYRHLRLDLSDVESVTSAFERDVAPTLHDEWSRIALVNNAASAALLGPIERLNATDLVALYVLNLAAPVWCMGFVSRHAPKSAAVRIVNVSSGAAVQGFAGLGGYGSSKAGLRMAGMVLAAEWESTVPDAPTRSNAAILSYEPGTVDTPMQEAARSYSKADFPWVGMFTAMHDRGVLVPPEAPAAEIVAFAESDGLPTFNERRLGR